ncbi:acyltransferase domain-containing protein, partial [Myxococcota bacterium]|nr:acyltransferase domain-containing protein [Myxococcota bacterium]
PASRDVAVVGIGVRLPAAGDVPALWRLLRDGRSAITDVPPDRFDADALLAELPGRVERLGGAFLDDVTTFDPEPFGLSDAVAEALDPQQRLFLEVSLEALGQAVVASDRVGVFAATGDDEYALRYLGAPALAGPHALLGALHSMIAGRVASVFGLTGPVLTVDTACSSSLAAVHLAMRSVRDGECDLAIAGGVQVNLTEQAWRYFAGAGLLARDGECRPFDRDASGLVPGEGAIAVLLKPLDAALADRDAIWGVLRGSAMNNDGGAVSGTAPNPRGQREVIEDAWRRAGLDPATASYVEAHAAGTALGDALEVASLAKVFRDAPSLPIGSVKSNLGHTFAVSGIAGLVKVLLALDHEELPPTIGCPSPAERIAFTAALAPCLERRSWPRGQVPRRAGVDSFGLGGTNVHVVVEEAPASDEVDVRVGSLRVPLVYPVAAATGGITRVAEAHRGRPGSLEARVAGAIRRARWGLERGAALVRDDAELDVALASMTAATRGASRLAFVVPGPGSQRQEMGRSLARHEPVFADAWAWCREAFLRHGVELSDAVAAGVVDRIDAAQPAVFAFAYASWCWLESLGVTPSVVLGHSAGEILAAHASGALGFEDAVALVVARGKAMAAAPEGGMIAVFAPERAVRALIERDRLPVAIAGLNAPEQTVVAAAKGELDAMRAAFEASGLAAKILPVTTPAHSPAMEPVADAFLRAMRTVEVVEPERPWISTRTGRRMTSPDADHWARQLLEPVRFVPAIEAALELGIDGFVELGATSGLTACIEAIAKTRAIAVPLGRRDEDELEVARRALAELWSAGIDVRLDRIGGGLAARPADVPAWPWARRRLWIDAPALPRASRPDGVVVDGASASITDHVTAGHTTAPAALLVDLLLAHTSGAERSAGLARVVVESPLAIAPDERVPLELACEDERWSVATERDGAARVHLRADVLGRPPRTFEKIDLPEISARCRRDVDVADVYGLLASSGFVVGPRMRGVRRVRVGHGELVAELATPKGGDRGRFVDPAILDGASQAVAALFVGRAASTRPFLGFSIGSISVWHPVHDAATAVIQLRSRHDAATNVLRYDILLADQSGRLLAEIRDFAAKRAEAPIDVPSLLPEPAVGASRIDGPRNDGPRTEGPRYEGPRFDGPQGEGSRRPSPRADGGSRAPLPRAESTSRV